MFQLNAVFSFGEDAYQWVFPTIEEMKEKADALISSCRWLKVVGFDVTTGVRLIEWNSPL
jgi:hypothetical protein